MAAAAASAREKDSFLVIIVHTPGLKTRPTSRYPHPGLLSAAAAGAARSTRATTRTSRARSAGAESRYSASGFERQQIRDDIGGFLRRQLALVRGHRRVHEAELLEVALDERPELLLGVEHFDGEGVVAQEVAGHDGAVALHHAVKTVLRLHV